jgi:TetR/AcrR family transcriptional regulator, transcriptional repressor of aconitase
MQDLVREAGMSSGAIYRYFDGKDAMILAICEENLGGIAAIVRESLQRGAGPGEAVASVMEYTAARHADDGFAAIALLVWSEALRNPALAARLRESFESAADALAEIARGSSVSPEEIPPDVLANTLLCMTPGYLLLLTIRGAADVKAIPDAVRALLPADGRSERSPNTRP